MKPTTPDELRAATARVWSVCSTCGEALRVLWGAGYVALGDV